MVIGGICLMIGRRKDKADLSTAVEMTNRVLVMTKDSVAISIVFSFVISIFPTLSFRPSETSGEICFKQK